MLVIRFLSKPTNKSHIIEAQPKATVTVSRFILTTALHLTSRPKVISYQSHQSKPAKFLRSWMQLFWRYIHVNLQHISYNWTGPTGTETDWLEFIWGIMIPKNKTGTILVGVSKRKKEKVEKERDLHEGHGDLLEFCFKVLHVSQRLSTEDYSQPWTEFIL